MSICTFTQQTAKIRGMAINKTSNQGPAPPRDRDELLQRAWLLAGQTLGQLAQQFTSESPEHLTNAKGWIGQLLELALGASAGSRAEQDFQHLAIELKSIPINASGQPVESTYVCTVPLQDTYAIQWETSWLKQKLSCVLWIPIEADKHIPIPQRHIGNPFLWQPNPTQQTALRQDWEEFMDLICAGRLEEISAHHGNVLQIRPKAASAKSLRNTHNDQGESVQTLPRGFYLRPAFTQTILQQHYWSLD